MTMEWDGEAIKKLRALWAEGHSTAEIGRRMGTSKNAIAGKAHRLALPARPSPIRSGGGASPRAPRQTLPSLVVGRDLPRIQPGVAMAGTGEAVRRAELAVQTRRLDAPRAIVGRNDAMLPKPLAEVQFQRISKPCCWPIGEPRTPAFRFCEAPGIPGKPYCPEHLAISRPKMREVEAA